MEKIIVISAAGVGRRMKSIGPKCLIKLSNRQTILSRQIKIFKKIFPNFNIVVVVGFQKEKIKDRFHGEVFFVDNDNYMDNNVGKSFLLALEEHKPKEAILVCGDLVFSKNIFNKCPMNSPWVMIDTNLEHRSSEVGCTIFETNVIHMSYGIWPKWAQIIYLKEKEILAYGMVLKNKKANRWFAFEFINEIISYGFSFVAFSPKKAKIVEVDTLQNLSEAKLILAKNNGQKPE